MIFPHAPSFEDYVRDLPRREFIQHHLSLPIESEFNLNVLLYCIWYGISQRGRLQRQDFKRLQAGLQPWHERVVLSLRQLAQTARNFRQCREWVEDEARAAERLELQILSWTMIEKKKSQRNPAQQLLDASHNIAAYYKISRIPFDDALRRRAAEVLQILFSDAEAERIESSLNQAIRTARFEDASLTQLNLI